MAGKAGKARESGKICHVIHHYCHSCYVRSPKEIVASVKELNSSIPKLREKISKNDCTHKEKTPKEESAVVVGKSSKNGNGPSFIT